MVRGVRSRSGLRLPAIWGYMDDVTTVLQTAACTARLLRMLDELLKWAMMKVNSTKSRTLSIWKGVNGVKIPLIADQPVRSLGTLCTADLPDKHMATIMLSQVLEGLSKIDRSFLPGKFKVCCYLFTLYQCLIWPLKLCDINLTTAEKMDSKANSYIRKWLGLPRCLSNMALFGNSTLKLKLKSISLGYKQEKVRLVFKLRGSPVLSVQNTHAQVHVRS